MSKKLFDLAEFIDLYIDHKTLSNEMGRRLLSIGLPSYEARGYRMLNCNSIVGGQLCPTCKRFHTTNASLCRDRLCPNCGWSLAHKRALAMYDSIMELSAQFNIAVVHVVLTIRHDSAADNFEQSLNALCAGLRRFIHLLKGQKRYKDFLGIVSSLEMLNDSKGLHPHVHMLWIVKREYLDHPIEQDALCLLWKNALQVDYKPITFIKLAYDKEGSLDFRSAVYECVKYNIKSADLLELSSYQLAKFAEAVHKKSLFHVSGKLLKSAFKDTMERYKVNDLERCDRCGGDLCDVYLTEKAINEVRQHAEV